MKKYDMKTLALIGVSSGLLISSGLNGQDKGKNSSQDKTKEASSQSDDQNDPNDGNLGYHLMTEDELMMELTPEGAKMFNSLDPEGKALALKVASMRCNNSNPCKGLNACKSDRNNCAGQANCRGQGKCAFSDKNLAVKVVYEKMKNKRAGAMNKY